jgi:Ca2+/Na+ antiporter
MQLHPHARPRLRFGVIILALATIPPEKFIAVLSGYRGHTGILVANTVGSNISLLSLCMGIVMVETEGNFDAGSVKIAELCVMWGTTLAFTATIWFGGRWSRWIGEVAFPR